MKTTFLPDVLHWLWLAVLIPLGWILRRLVKKYATGFEAVAAEYFERSGRWTARKLISLTPYLFRWLFRRRYRHCLIEDYRDYQIQGFKTRGPFVLDLEKVFVTLRLSPQSPERFTSDIISRRSQGDGFPIWELLATSPDNPYRCAAMIGPPGSGKTTLLRHLALIYSKRTHKEYSRSTKQIHGNVPKKKFRSLIPILIPLRDHVKTIAEDSAANLPSILGRSYLAVTSNEQFVSWISLELSKGNCLVMLDGLDEVGDVEQRKDVSSWINRQMELYPRSRFIVTSRPFGYLNNPIEHVRVVAEVLPFNLGEVDAFIKNWYLQNEIMRRLGRDDEGVRREADRRAHDLIKRIRSHPTLTNLAVNPLLLTMIAVVHDNRGALPGRRSELYAEICDVMLGRRQEAKGLTDFLSATQNQRVIQSLALKLMEIRVRTFEMSEASEFVKERLTKVAGPSVSAEDFLRRLANLSGLLVEREAERFEFAHKSFQEYLAAVEITEESLEDILFEHMDDDWWEETIRLVAVQTSAASKLLRRMLENATVKSLVLAYDFLNEGAELAAEDREELKRRIDVALESVDPKAARLAAEVKLTQRLRQLDRLDDGCWIDSNYITCAEYQLFLDDLLKDSKQLQPDHWEAKKFSSGTAVAPVLGLRASDAQEFCRWLGYKYSEAGATYRLPSPEELLLVPSRRVNISCWCQKETEAIMPEIGEFLQLIYDSDLRLSFNTSTVAASIERVLRNRGSSDGERLRFVIAFEDECRRAQKALRNPDEQLSFYELTRRYIVYDGAIGDRGGLEEIARVFARARNSARSRKLAWDLERAFGIDRSVDLASHLRQILERDISRDLSKDLEYAHEFAEKSFNADLPKLIGLGNESLIADIYAFAVISCRRRLGVFPAWEGLRIVKEITSPN